ncbi:hypothetical protein EV356DRAFT_499655 [Viridothelium virens]|uniref:Uncharacterized protein n=1 Tax=Viridothelium virens TaxID=1048519 RepID=A0A6A6HNC8_VIRVR|nr:hypothetical protein EV356DRAFT_499655 [Viridothelium virens]
MFALLALKQIPLFNQGLPLLHDFQNTSFTLRLDCDSQHCTSPSHSLTIQCHSRSKVIARYEKN